MTIVGMYSLGWSPHNASGHRPIRRQEIYIQNKAQVCKPQATYWSVLPKWANNQVIEPYGKIKVTERKYKKCKVAWEVSEQ